MQELVKLTNIYISGKKEKKESSNHQLLEGIAKYLTHMLKVCNPINVASVFGIDWFFLSNLIQVILKKIRANKWCETFLIQIFGAIEEEQAIGFPVAGKSAAANVRHLSIAYFWCIYLVIYWYI